MANLIDSLAAFMPETSAPDDVFMALGDYRFSMTTAAYETLRRETKWRWPSQERLGRVPAKQYVGPGEDTITLEGVVYPHFRGGLEQVDAMRDEADKGEPLLLVDGLGYVYDYWVVTSLSETHARVWEKGVPLKQQFSIVLEYFGEDDGAEEAAAVAEDAAAAASEAAAQKPASGLAGEISALKDKITSGVDAIKKEFNETAGPLVERATEAIKDVGATVQEVSSAINTVQNTVATVQAAKQSVETLTKSVKNVTNALGSLGSGNVLANISRVGSSLTQLQTAAGSASDALGNVDNLASKSSELIDSTLTNVQNAAYSASAALKKLTGNA